MMMKYVYLAVAVFTYGSYVYSVTHFFRPEKEVASRDYNILRAGSVITWALALRAIYFSTAGDFNSGLTEIGILLMVASLGFFWFTARHIGKHSFSIAFSKDAPQLHISDGPYKYVRHPFYFGYIFNYYAVAICTHSAVALACAVIMNLIYFRAAKMEEDKFLNSSYKETYQKYRASTGMLIPRIDRLWS